MAKPQCV